VCQPERRPAVGGGGGISLDQAISALSSRAASIVTAATDALLAFTGGAGLLDSREAAVGGAAEYAARCDAAVGMGIVDGLVKAIQWHAGSAAVVHRASAVLNNMTVGARGKALALQQGALATLVAALRAHPADANVARCACGALSSIAYRDRDLPFGDADAAAGAAAPAAIVEVMRVHVGDALVLRRACPALSSISLSFAPHSRASAIEERAPAALVAILRAHTAAADVAAAASAALSSVLGTLKDHGGAQARTDALAEGAIAALVAVLLAHANAAGGSVQAAHRACWALSYLADTEAGALAAIDAGAPAAIVAAMAVHVTAAPLQEYASTALSFIATMAGGGRGAAVVAAGGARAVINALMAHIGDGDVEYRGWRALLSLLHNGARARLEGEGSAHLFVELCNDAVAFPRDGRWGEKINALADNCAAAWNGEP